MGFHKNLNGDDVHVVHAYTYADATARGAATGFTSADVGKVAWQQDTDVLYLLTDDSPITWVAIGSGGGGSGDVVGPASATDNAIARYDGTTGKLIQNSGATIDDSGNITATNLSGTNTGDQTISLTGDVTGSGTESFAATIANQAVTFAKFQNISTAKLLGRYTSGSGSTEEVSLGNNLSYANSTLNAAGFLKTPVEAATTAALTVTSSGSGVGQTLTNAGAQAALVIDGVTMAANERVLVKDQATASQNGIYVVTDVGSVSTNWVLTRATDADGSDAGPVTEGMQVMALRGTTNIAVIWIQTTANPITVGSTSLAFSGNSAVSGGSISGSGTSPRLAYWNSSSALTSNQYFDITSDVLRHIQTASASATVVEGITLTNATTASASNQMYSGALVFRGNGWKTVATAASQPVAIRMYQEPVQSSNNPIATLVIQSSLNNGAYGTIAQFRDNGGSRSLLMTDGVVGIPAVTFFNDNDTGFYRSGSNALALVAGGSAIAGIDVNGFCVGTLGMNNANFGVHPTTTTKHGSVWRSRNSISVDYFAFQNDSATQEASLFRTSGTSGDWKWRMTGGTAALPSYSFYSQTTIGMYASGTNILGFSVAGAEAFKVSANTATVVYDASNYVDISVTSTGLVNLNAVGSGAAFFFKDHIYMEDAKDFSFSGTTGSKIGQGTSEKFAFWGTTPIIQPTTSVGSATFSSPGAGSAIKTDDTFDGYTLQQVVKALRNTGLLA